MTTTPQDPQDEYRQVYEAICAVAAHCDGAQEKDNVGFNGQDTHFGRRIAAMPFEAWTADIREEAARISRTYRVQAERYVGYDVGTLGVVQAASEETNKAARAQARDNEKRLLAEEKNGALKAQRKAVLVGGAINLSWNSKDPDCWDSLVPSVKALPGRRYSAGVNTVNLSIEALDFIEEFGPFDADFDVDALRNSLLAPAPQGTVAAAPAAPVAYNVRPAETDDKVKIFFDYNPAAVSAVRDLPGRKYQDRAEGKFNYADAHPAVLAFAQRFEFTVDPAVEANIAARADALGIVAEKENVLLAVSRMADPADLPEEFLAEVLARCPKARLVEREDAA